jgi:hypothetical protein
MRHRADILLNLPLKEDPPTRSKRAVKNTDLQMHPSEHGLYFSPLQPARTFSPQAATRLPRPGAPTGGAALNDGLPTGQ